ncbi:nucleotide-diphospho-sugar transferase-domain-containing protein [Gaertneriomyces semiglobifer]|nr:nucleotide-diphospho-sugar transferase-domain-containing protein [Gaertneriomyces semiglobifer]
MLVVLSSQYAGLRDNLVSVPARVTDERVEPVGEESTKLEPVRSEGKHDHPPIEGKEAGEIAKTPHSETNTEKKKDEHLASQDNGKIREKTEEMEKGAAVGSPVEKEKPATGLEPAADNGKGDSVRKPLVEELSPPSINKTLFAAMDMWAHRNVTDEKAEVEYIRYLARTVAINDTLVLIPTNDKFVDQALNLECSLIRHNRPNILFWALDFDAHIQLRALGRRTYYNPALYGTNQAVRYHAPDYNRMMRERPKVWQWFLEAGVSFLWMDADESALGDPFAPLKWDADIEVQVDGFENVLLHVNADSNSTFPVPGWGPCAGLFFLRPTAASITLMQSLRELMLTNQNLEDQQALAHVLLNRNRTFVLQAPPAHNTSPSPEQAREKGLFIARYVDPGKWVNGHPMREKIIYLDKEGKWYYHPRDGQRTFIDKPIVVHVNGLGQKKQFLQGLRAWFLDETNRCRVV